MKFFVAALFSLFFLATSLLAQPAAEEPAVIKTLSLWDMMRAGGPMMIPLGIFSVITVMLILSFLISLRRGAIVTSRYMQTADALIRKNDLLGLLAVSNRHNEAVARIIQRTLDFITKNPRAAFSDAREIAQTEGSRVASSMNQQVAYLADIGVICPMLGLLGTVIGIVQSFSIMTMDSAGSRPTLMAHGVGEALIATAAGLLVGIPAMAAYAFFRGRVQSLISDLESATTHLLAILSTDFEKERK